MTANIKMDVRFPSPPYYVSKECKLIPKAVDDELTRLDNDNELLRQLVREAQSSVEGDRDLALHDPTLFGEGDAAKNAVEQATSWLTRAAKI